MRIASFIQDSIVDGPGLRFTLFTQGCPHKCPGCHNPDTHPPSGGREESVSSIISAMLSNPLTGGLTLSGGEPFSQSEDCYKIALTAKEKGLNIWAYSGYCFEKLSDGSIPYAPELLSLCDVLVDGRFLESERDLTLKWRGSRNQRVIDVQASLRRGEIVLWEEPKYI
ncbi:anaerobic ribonucleoside-triphosphate reductase activating protein [Clostridiaceae bacterium OttesenSCG-928-D20]|nr:anaerobic ribonucleoside-triphosphate reductase activating protein [Clostridiaceae bacterium OttesenSCG-928-D20]